MTNDADYDIIYIEREGYRMKKVVIVWNGSRVKECANRRHAENYVKFINYARVYAIIEAEENEIEILILKAKAEQNKMMNYVSSYNGLKRFGRNYRA